MNPGMVVEDEEVYCHSLLNILFSQYTNGLTYFWNEFANGSLPLAYAKNSLFYIRNAALKWHKEISGINQKASPAFQNLFVDASFYLSKQIFLLEIASSKFVDETEPKQGESSFGENLMMRVLRDASNLLFYLFLIKNSGNYFVFPSPESIKNLTSKLQKLTQSLASLHFAISKAEPKIDLSVAQEHFENFQRDINDFFSAPWDNDIDKSLEKVRMIMEELKLEGKKEFDMDEENLFLMFLKVEGGEIDGSFLREYLMQNHANIYEQEQLFFSDASKFDDKKICELLPNMSIKKFLSPPISPLPPFCSPFFTPTFPLLPLAPQLTLPSACDLILIYTQILPPPSLSPLSSLSSLTSPLLALLSPPSPPSLSHLFQLSHNNYHPSDRNILLSKYYPSNIYTDVKILPYPSSPLLSLKSPALYQNLSLETLFFIYTFQSGTANQYFAAQRLRSLQWNLHQKYNLWFQASGSGSSSSSSSSALGGRGEMGGIGGETGQFVYFDAVNMWGLRGRNDMYFMDDTTEQCYLR